MQSLLQSDPFAVFVRIGVPVTHGPQVSAEPPVVFEDEQYFVSVALQDDIFKAVQNVAYTQSSRLSGVQKVFA